MTAEPFEVEPVIVPIDGVLDLHNFRPNQVGEVVEAYLEACLEEGIVDVRIIHGKGTGSLRRSVHAILSRSDDVESFQLAEDRSSWGATTVRLRNKSQA